MKQIHDKSVRAVYTQVGMTLHFVDQDQIVQAVYRRIWTEICGDAPLGALDPWVAEIGKVVMIDVDQLPLRIRAVMRATSKEAPVTQALSTELIQYTRTPIYHWMQQRVFNTDPEDLTEEVMLRGWQWICGESALYSLDRFVATLCRRVRIDYLRTLYRGGRNSASLSAQRKTTDDSSIGDESGLLTRRRIILSGETAAQILGDIPDPMDIPEEVARRELEAVLHRALAALREANPIDHRVLVQYYLEQISERALADQLGISRDRVRTARDRALRFLRGWLTAT